MKSQYVTDDTGQRLRATYFPFQVDKTSPPTTAGFSLRTRGNEKLLMPISPQSKQLRKAPSRNMIIDYNQDRQYLNQIAEGGHDAPEFNYSVQRNRLTIKPTQLKQQLSHPACPLRSAFVLKQKVDISTPELESCISQQLFNKQDAASQTEATLLRHNFKGVTEYNEWSNAIAEPFFKVGSCFL
jgi:hypothetical protein